MQVHTYFYDFWVSILRKKVKFYEWSSKTNFLHFFVETEFSVERVGAFLPVPHLFSFLKRLINHFSTYWNLVSKIFTFGCNCSEVWTKCTDTAAAVAYTPRTATSACIPERWPRFATVHGDSAPAVPGHNGSRTGRCSPFPGPQKAAGLNWPRLELERSRHLYRRIGDPARIYAQSSPSKSLSNCKNCSTNMKSLDWPARWQ